MQITVNLQRLTEYATKSLAETGTLWEMRISKLDGGFASDGVYRLDLTFRLDDGSFETVSVVQKYTSSAEVHAMELLDRASLGSVLPKVMDSSERDPKTESKINSWFTVPFYEGKSLTFDDAIPADVIRALARVHAHFSSHVGDSGQAEGLRRFDSAFSQETFKNALDSLVQMPEKQRIPDCDALHSALMSISQSAVFNRALAKLPVTLVHGDVHPGNIMRSTKGESVLIDWGNARIAPQMLDLANVVPVDSDNWLVYLDTWQEMMDQPMDYAVAELGHRWATAMVPLQYLPFAAVNLPDAVPGMIESIRQTEEQLTYLLKSNNR